LADFDRFFAFWMKLAQSGADYSGNGMILGKNALFLLITADFGSKLSAYRIKSCFGMS
jgi:hypothetical protein